MRLLQLKADDSLSLVEFMDRDPETYAILSYTWGPNNEEITWFTRVWTLQELLAPNSVELFSLEGNILGDKHTRAQEISEVIDIAIEAIRGEPMSQYSVGERMTWAKRRTTTRKEDAVYSLLGIFDIQMPLLYGEGEEKTRRRLHKEIREFSTDTLMDTKDLAREVQISKIHRWLSPPDPSVSYQKALRQRQHGTGLWFLCGEQYKIWKTSAASLLWLYGIPGCGKTILGSTTLQDLLQYCDHHTGNIVAYFYFDFSDVQKQNEEWMLRSLFCQLLRHTEGSSPKVEDFYTSHGNGATQPSLDALLDMLRATIEQLPQVYVVLDALDECSQRDDLMEIIETVTRWDLQNMHLIITSRRERDIESSLDGLVDTHNAICLQSDEVDKDIHQYVRQRLSDDKGLSKWARDVTLQQEIETAILKGSKGIRYRIRHSHSAIGGVFRRPLSLDELAEVIAIDVARKPAFDSDEILEDPQEVFNICSSLVTISTETTHYRGTLEGPYTSSTRQVVILAHYSVKEYLVSDRIRRCQTAHYDIQAIECHNRIAVAYLSYLEQFQDPRIMDQDVLSQYPLASYSAEYWANHINRSEHPSASTSSAALRLLSKDNIAYLIWNRICDGFSHFSTPGHKGDLKDPIYHASSLGREEIVKLLLERDTDINGGHQDLGGALVAACEISHEAIVTLLLNRGADPNSNSDGYTALKRAVDSCHKAIVKLLINQGASVNDLDGNSSALVRAVTLNERGISELLLDGGAALNDGYGDSRALEEATSWGDKEMVNLLLSRGASVGNTNGKSYSLEEATMMDRREIVTLLLDRGASVNNTNRESNPLNTAILLGRKEIVALFLDRGAATNWDDGTSALEIALKSPCEEIVVLLLDRGAADNGPDGCSDALDVALKRGKQELVDLLIANGAKLRPNNDMDMDFN
ncbi:Ankyrin repeat protein [Pyrenophora tritici-repentis]|nr:Ankyrin repeat protein [Pyrenophora tritici-repentis]